MTHAASQAIKYCNQCGTPVATQVPPGDDRPRAVCGNCGHVQYVNPKLIVGCLAEYDGKILLAKRAIAPRKGYWTLPAGFMELQETTAEGAARETREEACAEVEALSLYTVINVPHISQVYLIYRGTLIDGAHAAGPESLDTHLVAPNDIPWDELAFPTMRCTLQHYVRDLATGMFPTHTDTIAWPASVPRPTD